MLKPKTILLIVLFILSGAIFFRIGVHYGVYQFILIDSPHKANLAAMQLQHHEKTNFWRISHEYTLTKEITNYGLYLDHGKPWIFWPCNNPSCLTAEYFPGGNTVNSPEKFINAAIRYRKNNPVKVDFSSPLCSEKSKKSYFCKNLAKRKAAYHKAISSVD